MGIKLSLIQRIRAGLSFVTVFLLVLATNLIDSNHFSVVKENLKTVYEDRLLAKDYLYRISRQVQLKKELMQHPGAGTMNEIKDAINDSIQTLITRFATTELTEKESIHFQSLKDHIQSLSKFEGTYIIDSSLAPEAPFSANMENHFLAINDDLDALFKIQLVESNRIIASSNQVIDKSNLISTVEIVFLIVLGIIIQLLIFVKPLK